MYPPVRGRSLQGPPPGAGPTRQRSRAFKTTAHAVDTLAPLMGVLALGLVCALATISARLPDGGRSWR